MYDTIELRWDPDDLTSAPRRARRAIEPHSGPVRIDLKGLLARHGASDSTLTLKSYGHDAILKGFGRWFFDRDGCVVHDRRKGIDRPVELLVTEWGRVVLRCALPKLIYDYNDQLLDERTAHDALRRLVAIGREATGVDLNLREAALRRLDLCYQWEVDSVSEQLNWLATSVRAPRRKFELHTNPAGGRSMYWGKKTKLLLRFYDKGAEARKKREQVEHEVDRILRFEIQDKRTSHLALIHEDGYRAATARERLQEVLDPFARIGVTDLAAFLAADASALLPADPMARLGLLYANDHPHVWPIVKKTTAASSFYKHRARARHVSISQHEWRPRLPEDAFERDFVSSSLWADELRQDAA